jgi:hypothetical protein
VDTHGQVAGATGTNVTLILSNSATLTWLWATNFYLSSTNAPAVGGSVGGATNGFYMADTNVTLTATTNAGYRFAYWSGDVSGTATNAILACTMSQARTVVAHFTADSNLLFVIASEHGQGTPPVGSIPTSPVWR